MKAWWWGGVAVAASMIVSCTVDTAQRLAPGAWDTEATATALGAPEGDPWCAHVADLRTHLDGAGPEVSEEAREAALTEVRAEAQARGDAFWPYRKALICELTAEAGEEAKVYEWVTVNQFLDAAQIAATAEVDGVHPLVPFFDPLEGGEADALAPVDLADPAYCDMRETAERALAQQRGDAVAAVSFPGSMQRAPDWIAHVQVAYHRWGREMQERGRLAEDPEALGDAPRYCRRFHAALEGSKKFAVKDNLIFLLPELDDPERSGHLVVEDAQGRKIVLDRVLAAAQLDAGGTGGALVDFFAEDLAAAPGLSAAVNCTNALPPPKVFSIHFASNARTPLPDDPEIKALIDELASRDPAEPLRIALLGHADCVGPRWYNTMISEDRANNVFETIVRPALAKRGFSEALLADRKRFKTAGLGKSAPIVESGPRCAPEEENRAVVVVVQ